MQPESNSQPQSQQQSLHSLRIKPQQNQSKKSQQNENQYINQQQLSKNQNSFQQQQSLSNYIQQQLEQQLSQIQNITSQQIKKKSNTISSQQKKSQISNFIIKTYKILQDPINSNIIHWTDQGNAFIVKNKQKFQNQILPKYFKHKKFSSFVRQLNMYDFHKIRKQKQIPIFKHKYFKQGSIQLLCKIKRKSGQQTTNNLDNQDQPQTINQVMTKNYIPSLADFVQKPPVSVYSLKSKSQLPYPSIFTSQPSIGLLPGSGAQATSQLDLLIQQNTELTSSISQLSREQVNLQLQRQLKRQKVAKILSILMNCDLNQMMSESGKYDERVTEIQTLRDLQKHFSSQEQPFTFVQYVSFMRKIYTGVKSNMLKINNFKNIDELIEQKKIQQ